MQVIMEGKHFFLISLILIVFAEAAVVSRFTSASATSFNQTFATVNFCYVKAYSRRTAVLNVNVKLHKEIMKPFFVSL